MSDAADFLQSLHRLAHRAWAREGVRIGLSHSEFEYLAAIQEEARTMFSGEDVHGQHLHNIVDRLGVSKASASAMVSKLEARGLIDRIACQMDARAQHIILTEAGSQRLTLGAGVYEAIVTDLPDDLAKRIR